MEISRVEQIFAAYSRTMKWAAWLWLLLSGLWLGSIEEDSLIVTLIVLLLPLLLAGGVYWLLRQQAQSHMNRRMALAFDQLVQAMRAGSWEGYRGVATCVDMFGFGRLANVDASKVQSFMAAKGATIYVGQGETPSFNLEKFI